MYVCSIAICMCSVLVLLNFSIVTNVHMYETMNMFCVSLMYTYTYHIYPNKSRAHVNVSA